MMIFQKNLKKILWAGFFILAFSGCSHFQSDRKMQSKKIYPIKPLKNRLIDLGTPQAIPNIEKMKWHLQITKTEKAWQLSRGNKNIVVAVIDSGVDIHHPDLKDNIWVNSIEKNGKKGVDDDLNGFIDDIHGWNFADNNNNVMDSHGHGTHVAGIIGGQGKICKPGVSPKVSLMVLKYYNPSGRGNENLINEIESIRYAIQNGAHIINFSGGGPEPNSLERAIIEQGLEKDVLFVTAGGNQHSNIEEKPYYPASYNLPNLLSVGASNPQDEHSSFSNRGRSILAHAPGTRIYSTLPMNLGKCGFLTGTSQSTPIFAGGAVLVKTYKKLQKPADIIRYLLKTADLKQHLVGKSQTGRRANFYRALGSEHLDVALNGTRVQYTDHPVGRRNEDGSSTPSENTEVNLEPIKISLFEDNKKTRRTPSSQMEDEESSKIQAWVDIDGQQLPLFVVDPSQFTKFFLGIKELDSEGISR